MQVKGVMDMKKRALMLMVPMVLVPCTCYADSSWSWMAGPTPSALLPYAVILTLVIEIGMIQHVSGQESLARTGLTVTGANLVSFLVPMAVTLFLNPVHQYPATLYDYYWIVSLGYLMLTLALEVPIVYHLLKNHCRKQEKLLKSIILSNIITTAIVCCMERFLCHGCWI